MSDGGEKKSQREFGEQLISLLTAVVGGDFVLVGQLVSELSDLEIRAMLVSALCVIGANITATSADPQQRLQEIGLFIQTLPGTPE